MNFIFLRGLTRGAIHWGPFKTLLEQKKLAHEIEFLELPGNGELAHLHSPTEAHLAVELLRKNSLLLQKKEPVHLIGISLGGMIALKWSELYPDEVLKTTVINTSLNQLSFLTDRLKPQTYLKILKLSLSQNKFFQEENILKLTSNKKPESHSAWVQIFAKFSETYPFQKINLIKQLQLASSIKVNLKPLKNIQVLVSKNDRLVSAKCSYKLCAELRQLPEVHPWAGHDLPYDDPEWLFEQIFKVE